MNPLQARHFFGTAWRLAAWCAVLLAAGGVRGADDSQPARFLLIYEASPAVKKNLPEFKQVLARLLSSNFQHEIQSEDDLAVWTVDQALHTGGFPLASWEPDEAEDYSERLADFFDHQKTSRHASLTAVQPLLNRVVKNSDRLTVVIFCDSQSRLAGTPYDSGVNDIITNAAAKVKDGPAALVLVLRAYHGQYLGCSVNRSGTLNFPKFPPPPQPPAAPVVSKPPPPAPPAVGPVVTPVAAMIITGTNETTNLPAATRPVPAPTAPPPAPAPAATNVTSAPAASPGAPLPPAAVTVPKAVVASPPNPPPAQAPPLSPLPAPVPVLPKPSPPPAPAVSVPSAAAPGSTPVAPETKPASPAAGSPPADASYVWPLTIGGGALAVAGALVAWLVVRARRPRGSLITSSMLNDPRPPRK